MLQDISPGGSTAPQELLQGRQTDEQEERAELHSQGEVQS